eukprot:gene34668-44829_t
MGAAGSTSSGGLVNSSTGEGKKKKKKEAEAEAEKRTGMTVFFGSQTGTAEGFARTLMEESNKHGFDVKVFDLESFSPESVSSLSSEHVAVFLMATYGEGEPTDNAVSFFKYITNKDEPPSLPSLRYTVFGLGNKQYEHFNRVGKLTDRKLQDLGASRVFDYGEGDDDANLEEDFDHWKAKINKSSNASESGTSTVVSKFKVVAVESASAYVSHREQPVRALSARISNAAPSSRHFFNSPRAIVSATRELRSGLGQGSTRHVELETGSVGLVYLTADNLAVLPENTTVAVEAVASAMGYDLDSVVNLTSSADEQQDFKLPFPVPCSVRDLLTLYLDLQGELKYATAKQLRSKLAADADLTYRELFEQLVSDERRPQFKAAVQRSHLSLGGLLTLQPPLFSRLSLEELLQVAQLIQPRYYTISLTQAASIALKENEDNKEAVTLFTGLCSGFLCGMPAQQSCRVFVRASSFRLPPSSEEREFQRAKGASVLFFGCQRRDTDFLYKDELEAFQQRGVLTSLYTAFSREGASKVYVQHLMLQDQVRVYLKQLVLEQGAYVYVCGATAMGADVMKAFTALLNDSEDAAHTYIKQMQETGRYVQELWSV